MTESIAWIGRAALIAATAAFGAAGLLRVAALRRASGAPKSESGRDLLAHRLHFVGWALVFGAMLLLIGLFLTDAFAFTYVAGRSNRAMAAFYKVTALWAGQEGSLLFWLWLQSLFGLVVSRRGLPGRAIDRGAAGFLAFISAFFAILVAFVVDPFAFRLPAPADGAGMNPILQSYWMTVHPVMLYLGYVGFSVPFAYAAAALVTPDDAWVGVTRRWSLVAWTFLSIGILFGARWAYEELGWGGYWGWDPVENASFMPWLVATAFIHSGMIQERRGMLKRWNHALIFITYFLTIFGTFITRSGILSSVHAFVESDISPWFIGYAGLVSALFLYGVILRWPELADERRIESPLSKESSFLANNVVLLATAFAIFWGTVFPLVASALGRQVTVGAPYFDRVTGPLFWILIVLMGIGPLIGWRRASARQLKKHFTAPLINGLFMAVWLVVAGMREPAILLSLPAAVFVLTTIVMEFARGTEVRARTRGEPLWLALPRMMKRNPGRYGGYLVHAPVLLIAAGIAISQTYQVEQDAILAVGESAVVGPYRVTLFSIDDVMHGSVPAVEASLLVEDAGGPIGFLQPSKRFYPGSMEMGPTTETAIYGNVKGDVYAVLAGWEPHGSLVGFTLYYNPMVWLIWAGGVLLVFGSAFSLWPRRERVLVESERALVTLAELEYDFQMGKVGEAQYRAIYRELAPKALAYVEREAEAVAAVVAEVKARLGETGARAGARTGPGPKGSVVALLCAAALGALAWGGVAQAQDAAIVVPAETLVLRIEDGRLHALDLVTVRNIAEAPVEVVLPLPEGALWTSAEPERLTPGEGGAVDPLPLEPGEERRYTLQYQLMPQRWPHPFTREIIYPTQSLRLLAFPGEIEAGGIDIGPIGLQEIAGTALAAYESAWLAPGTLWQAVLFPGPQAGPLVGWNPALLELPVVGGADHIPGAGSVRWLAERPLVLGAMLVFVLALVAGLRRAGRSAAPDDPVQKDAGGTGGDPDRIEGLARAIARLDLAYREGALAKGAYHRRRKGLMSRLTAEIERLGPGGEAVLSGLLAAEERDGAPQSAGRR